MKTPVIRYNLKDRGRKFTGLPRNFNVRSVCDAINSAACQETVASRGMIGFYGHLPRVRYGLKPAEGGIEKGKYAPVEPAFVTTYLKADYEGNVEHRAEFLDTTSGQLVAKLWGQQVGGFSSAINRENTAFYGFDYVTQPNFLENSFRGVVLDDVLGGGAEGLAYDDVYTAEHEEQARSMMILLDSVQAERTRANEVIERLSAENEQLLSMLAAKGMSAAVVLDGAHISPIAVAKEPMERLLRDAEAFRYAELPAVLNPDDRQPERTPLHARLLNRLMHR